MHSVTVMFGTMPAHPDRSLPSGHAGACETVPYPMLNLAAQELLGQELGFWVAVGTLALAVATVALAWYTRKLGSGSAEQLEALRRQAVLSSEANRIAQQGLDSQREPLIVEAPQHPTERGDPCVVSIDADSVRVAILVRNIGPGLAAIRQARLMRPNPGVEGYGSAGTSQRSVPPSETFVLEGADGHEDLLADARQGGPLFVEVDYADASGQRMWLARFRIRQDSFSRAWYVMGVEHDHTMRPAGSGDE